VAITTQSLEIKSRRNSDGNLGFGFLAINISN